MHVFAVSLDPFGHFASHMPNAKVRLKGSPYDSYSVLQIKFLLFPRHQNAFFFKKRLQEYTGN